MYVSGSFELSSSIYWFFHHLDPATSSCFLGIILQPIYRKWVSRSKLLSNCQLEVLTSTERFRNLLLWCSSPRFDWICLWVSIQDPTLEPWAELIYACSISWNTVLILDYQSIFGLQETASEGPNGLQVMGSSIYSLWTCTDHCSSFFYVIVLHIIAWVYAWVVQEKYTANPPSLDWSDKGFTRGLFVVILWGKKLDSSHLMISI